MKYQILYHKYNVIAIVVTLLILGISTTIFVSAKRYSPQKIKLGIYDPARVADSQINIGWQSDFAAWSDPADLLQNKVHAATQNNRISLLSLEPWPTASDPAQMGNAFLQKVSAGAYDPQIATSCGALVGESVLMRWGHEMELTTGRYPWSGATPQTYIEAYRHFVSVCRKWAPTIQFVWSPAGEQGSEQYWPGGTYVDYIGISAYGFDAWDIAQGLSPRSFIQIAKTKLARMAKFNKAIIVAEMGVTGADSYKINWLSTIKVKDLASPNLIGFVYFNSKDVDGAWGPTLPTPDWRLSPAGLQAFAGLAAQ